VPDPSKPASEFADEQIIAHTLAGTVMLPAPFPASARIYIGIKPRKNAKSAERFYLKIVEVVSDKYVATRLVNLDDFRAVRLRPDASRGADLRDWTFKTADDLQTELEEAKATLRQAASEDLGAHELSLFSAGQSKAPERQRSRQVDDAGRAGQYAAAAAEPEGVVHVPESAPVLVRVEYGVVAAEAVVAYSPGPLRSRCCAEHPFVPA
jgi:hypothetical protein